MQKRQDKHLGSPGEANTEKHINFLKAEEKTASENMANENRFDSTREDAERRKQWQQGVEEGRNEARKNNDS